VYYAWLKLEFRQNSFDIELVRGEALIFNELGEVIT
jgi:hypothetical protein